MPEEDLHGRRDPQNEGFRIAASCRYRSHAARARPAPERRRRPDLGRDGDGIGDLKDGDDDGDGIADAKDSDDDNDGLADRRDADDDNDGVPDTREASATRARG